MLRLLGSGLRDSGVLEWVGNFGLWGSVCYVSLKPSLRQPELCTLSTTQCKSRTGVSIGLARMARFRLPEGRFKG